jgi:hypothetical protein
VIDSPAAVRISTVPSSGCARLALRFPAVSGDQVAAVVRACYSRFDGRPIRDYVPLFVERGARSRLAELSG